jgi:hypothetical protein
MTYDTTTSRMKIMDHYSDVSTKIVGLGNLFDLNEIRQSKDPNFFKELRAEVKEECEAYGRVKAVKVDKKNMVVFVKFKDIQDAMVANDKLQDRVFSEKPIVTAFYNRGVLD